MPQGMSRRKWRLLPLRRQLRPLQLRRRMTTMMRAMARMVWEVAMEGEAAATKGW